MPVQGARVTASPRTLSQALQGRQVIPSLYIRAIGTAPRYPVGIFILSYGSHHSRGFRFNMVQQVPELAAQRPNYAPSRPYLHGTTVTNGFFTQTLVSRHVILRQDFHGPANPWMTFKLNVINPDYIYRLESNFNGHLPSSPPSFAFFPRLATAFARGSQHEQSSRPPAVSYVSLGITRGSACCEFVLHRETSLEASRKKKGWTRLQLNSSSYLYIYIYICTHCPKLFPKKICKSL